ncbi:hypothetical protein JCM11641_004744 [Rhodosporidiobolus odoratus]
MRIHSLFFSSLPLASSLAFGAPASHDYDSGGDTVVGEYGQCGGAGWTGGNRCLAGWTCTKSSEWYSQCKEADKDGCGNGEWSQCGGNGYAGETCCQIGTTCVEDSEWWHYCSATPVPSCKPETVTVTKTVYPSSHSSSRTTTSHTVSQTSPSSHTPRPSSSTESSSRTSSHTSSTTPSSSASVRPSVTSRPKELRLSPYWDTNAPPQRREYFFEIDARPGSPDGFNRSMLVVNGQFPGPLIEVNAGDTVVVHVKNSLDFQMALHWHGIQQNGTIWEDGPSGVTQCPINSKLNYTYEFKVVGNDPYGTLWWHAHRGAYYADGIIGPLIVHSPEDPLVRGTDYDVDQIILWNDWYHTASDVIVGALNTPEGFNGTAVAPSPQSGLVNGHGIYDCGFAEADQPCFQQTALLELIFPPDALVRLRFINAGSHPVVWFSVDEHELAVIEADDTPTQPQLVHRVPVNVAQRYSGVLDTSGHQVGDSFYLRAQMNTGCFGAPFPDLNPQTLVIIRIGYANSSLGDDLPTSQDWSDPTVGDCVDLDESTLVPRIAVAAPSTVSQRSFFNTSFAITDIFRWTMNDVSFENFAYNPILLQYWRGQTVDPGRVAIVEAGLGAMDLVLYNTQGADHPLHLHNIRMFILGRGTGAPNTTALAAQNFNTTNPIRRDTIGVSPGTWVLARLVTDIVGVHAFHCHILFHQAVGLLGALVVQPEAIPDLPIPQKSFDLCIGGNGSIIDPGRKRSFDLPALPAAPVDTAVPVKTALPFTSKAKKSLSGWWSTD